MTNKEDILLELFNKYKSLRDAIILSPLSRDIKSVILQSLDTGFLWIKEGFSNYDLHCKKDEE